MALTLQENAAFDKRKMQKAVRAAILRDAAYGGSSG
jgi:hypothetical protein